MNRNKLISLAMNFSSFLVGQVEVKSIILFGSVARNNFDEESDIDLFVECDKKDEKKVEIMLDLYKKTEEYEKFILDGVKNELSIKSGRLDDWRWELDSAWRELSVDAFNEDEGRLEGNTFINKINKLNELIAHNQNNRVKLYKILETKEIMLRRLEDKAGKGAKRREADEDDMED